ncbi:cupin domain-containing protein [Pseudomonas guariconensis]|uniref:cupin domain-containing protein n=2 Tax=Pseudomonas TaxID=286 RepID=UPI002097B19A|nr:MULTISPECIES: cupin domain-containing protein [Pseudomonas]MCO7516003.1 cupin domain-containing protein [Pseudomonas putida]MCO7608372.1 cupin domain-containing protein [Pseudomonas guariconensis]
MKICSGQIRFDRLKRVEGEPAYFYRHVMKTSADKNLMVLRTSPLFTSPDKAPVNKGHQAKEFVYVLSGAVGVLWCNKVGERREDVLAVGDSIFIDAWVPHAFYALESGSQILAVDYT